MRLDKYLVDEGYYESRNRALDAIKAGSVRVDGEVVKPSYKIGINSMIDIADEKFYVSRAARKIESFLADHPIDMRQKRALDIGSSTGGFAQILLEEGVISLSCVDVGRDQLHHSIRDDARVSVYEGIDIREFDSDEKFEVVSCDVSFISILQIIDDIDRLSCGDIIILYKPQFEVGRDIRRDSRGVVLDLDAILSRRVEFELRALSMGWTIIHHSPSSVAGREGNVEYIYHFRRGHS